jgi:uncharacterized membrane protein YkoI
MLKWEEHDLGIMLQKASMAAIRMAGFRFLPMVLAAALLAAAGARAADADCLSKAERRAVLSSGKAISLAQAIRAVKPPQGEVVGARLCKGGTGYVYLLTLLSRDGKVRLVTVDAVSGRLAGR